MLQCDSLGSPIKGRAVLMSGTEELQTVFLQEAFRAVDTKTSLYPNMPQILDSTFQYVSEL